MRHSAGNGHLPPITCWNGISACFEELLNTLV